MARQEDFDTYHDDLAKYGLPRAFERSYNNMRDAALRGTWQGLTKIAASNFGKGALIAAAIFLLVPMIGFGLATAGGVMTASYAGAQVGVGSAMLGGLTMGWNFITTSWLGAGLVAAVGGLFAGAAVNKEKKEIAELTQQAQLRQLEKIIELERGKEKEKEPAKEVAPKETAKETAPKEKEAAKEAAPKAAPVEIPPAQEEPATQQTHFRERVATKPRPESFVAAENDRRVATSTQPALGAPAV